MHNLAWNGTECFVVSISNCDDDITSPISVCLFMLPLFCLAIQVQLVNMITVIIWEGGSGLLGWSLPPSKLISSNLVDLLL